MHSVIWWIIVGFLAGVLAKAMMPGDRSEPKGCLYTILLGVAGSLLAGFIMRAILGTEGSGSTIGTIIGAALGAMLLIWLFRLFAKK